MKFSLRKLLILAVLAASFATYYATLDNGFVADDHTLIEKNPWISSFSNLPSIFSSDVHAFKTENPITDYYRPLLFTIYSVEYALFGLKPWGWHLFNVLFHSLSSVLVLLTAERLLRERADEGGLLFPFAAALLFAAHPVNAESVSWLACVCELSYTLFTLLALYLYIVSTEAGKGAAFALRASSIASFLLAAFSKETALVFPAILLSYGLLIEKRPGTVKRSLPYWAVAFFYLALRALMLERLVPPANEAQGAFYYASNILTAAWMYIWKFILPFGMSIYNVADGPSAFDARLILYGAALAAVFSALYLIGRKDPRAAFLALLMVLPLLPTLVLLNKSVDIYYINRVAERYLYLPMAGFSMLAALGLKALWGRLDSAAARRAVLALVFAGLSGLAVISAQRAAYWKDDLSIWNKAVEDDPENYFAHYIIGLLHSSEGLDDRAVEKFKEALRIRPSLTGPHQQLGLIYMSRSMYHQAEAEFLEVLKVNPENGDAFYNIGLIHMDQGDWQGALDPLKNAQRHNRGSRILKTHNALAVVYANLGRLDETRRELKEAYMLDPNDRETLDNIGHLRDRFGIEVR